MAILVPCGSFILFGFLSLRVPCFCGLYASISFCFGGGVFFFGGGGIPGLPEGLPVTSAILGTLGGGADGAFCGIAGNGFGVV